MKNLSTTMCLIGAAVVLLSASPAAAQLSLQWMVPAAANTSGVNGTYWRTDLSLHNPHAVDLPVVLQFLPSGSDNLVADTLLVTLQPWETFNLWDVLGPNHFDAGGTGALLVFADWDLACEPAEDCDFLVTSRTYTIDSKGGVGEYGQTVPGANTWQGVDWETLGYAAGILNDGVAFRANLGVASWSADWTTVAADIQDASGAIIDSLSLDVPPFGHLQKRLTTPLEGGSVVFWIENGPDDALVFGYVSVVDETTGDASFQLAQPSPVGFAAAKATRRGILRRIGPTVGTVKERREAPRTDTPDPR
jgi:hypothetical protein